MRVLYLLVAVLLSNLNAAPPVISSASLSDGVVTITGSGFGTKAVAAPLKFQPFTSTVQGQNYTQSGFDFVGGNNYAPERNHVDMGDGVGGGSWLHVTPGGGHESFSHFGHLLPDSTNAVYASCWFSLRRLSPLADGSSRFGQMKVMRSGIRTSLDPIEGMYRRNPKVFPSLYDRLADSTDRSGPNTDWNNATAGNTPTATIYPEGRYDVQLTSGGWIFCEIYYRMNALGQANGVIQIRFNQTLHIDVANMQARTSAGEYFGYLQYNPGEAGAFDESIWHVRASRIYLDTTRARVFLGNASTLAGCTGRFLLAPTAWRNTAVSAGAAVNIPAGYAWAYVSNHEGEINATGYSLQAGPPPPPPAPADTCGPDTAYAVQADTARYQVISIATIRTITACQPVSRMDTTVARDTVPQ